MQTFEITDNQLKKILRAPKLQIEFTDQTLAELRRELTSIRIEILKAHAFAPEGQQSILRRKLKALPERLKKLEADLNPQTDAPLLRALKGAEYERRTYEKAPQFDFDRLNLDLASLRLLAADLIDRIALLDLYQDPMKAAKVRVNLFADLGDETLAARYSDSMENLYRLFREREQIETPIIVALIGLSRCFERNFPNVRFMTSAQHNKDGSAIEEDLRYDNPGARFGAQALEELGLFGLFKKKSPEQVQTMLGDAWFNNKEDISKAENLYPTF
ncbi:MAG: hypothetical protein J0G33_12645 [Afipia felis]|nr:hypothetical protein [Afipia felis]